MKGPQLVGVHYTAFTVVFINRFILKIHDI